MTVRLLLVGLILALPARAGDIPAALRQSGYAFMGPQARAIQDDETANPGMLWVLDGESLWNRPDGAARRSCADCHGAANASMRGVAARYPSFDAGTGRPIDLEQRINACRTQHQQASPFAFESHELLALTAFVARQSRGQPITAGNDPRSRPFIEAGRTIFQRRQGQLNLSCAQCHDDHWGQKLAGAPIPQAHPTGYPQYRLEWQAMGSLQRRLRNCLIGMRAAPFAYESPEMIDLELFLMSRARGLPIESPAVRP